MYMQYKINIFQLLCPIQKALDKRYVLFLKKQMMKLKVHQMKDFLNRMQTKMYIETVGYYPISIRLCDFVIMQFFFTNKSPQSRCTKQT